MGSSPWGCKESDRSEGLTLSLSLSLVSESTSDLRAQTHKGRERLPKGATVQAEVPRKPKVYFTMSNF